MRVFIIGLFLAILLAWGYRLCDVPQRHSLLLCGKYTLYTSKAITGHQIETEGNPDKDQYFLTFMEKDKTFDLECSRADSDNATIGDTWEYFQTPNGHTFKPKP